MKKTATAAVVAASAENLHTKVPKHLLHLQHIYLKLKNFKLLITKAIKNDRSMNEVHVEVLSQMMGESKQIIENIELDTTNQK